MTEPAIRVLVAEDDVNARSLLVDLLRSMGHLVVGEVGTGREAVGRAVEVDPDVVLLDVHMPDGSGIEAAEEITQALPATAVVLFSGDPTVTLSSRDITATAAIAFLPKPAPPKVLDTTLRLAVSRARALASARKDATSAREQLENRKLVERARGIMMCRSGASEEDACRMLQRASQVMSMPRVDVARLIIESEAEPGKD